MNHSAETQPVQKTELIDIRTGLDYSEVGWSVNEDVSLPQLLIMGASAFINLTV